MIVDGRTARGRRTTTGRPPRGRRDGKGFFLLRSGKRADERRSIGIGSDHITHRDHHRPGERNNTIQT